MEGRNFQTRDSTYLQTSILTLANPGLELRYKQEIKYLHSCSFRAILWCCVVACLFQAALYSDWRMGTLGLGLGVYLCDLRAMPQRLLSCCLAVLFEIIAIKSGSIGELFGALLFSSFFSNLQADYFSGGQWRSHLLWGLVEVFALSAFGKAALIKALFALAVHVTLFSFVEKDDRMLWIMMDSFKKSDGNHKAVFNQSDQAIFIVNLARKVEYSNIAAKKTFMSHTTSLKIDEILPPSCQQAITNLLSVISSGGKAVEEVVLKPVALKFDHELLTKFAIKLEGKPISWKQANCMMLSVENISHSKAKMVLIYSRHKKAMDNLNLITREIERIYTEGQPLRRVDLERQLKARLEFLKLSFLEMSTIGIAEIEQVRFSPFEEALRAIELVIEKAYERRVEVCLTKETSIPQVVRGSIDATNVLLSCLLEFCLLEVVPSGQILLNIEVSIIPSQADTEHSLRLRYRAVFKPMNITTERLQRLFNPCKNKPDHRGRHGQDLFVDEEMSLQEICGLVNKYGASLCTFKAVLQSLEGTVDDAYVQEGAYEKVIISYS